MGQHFLNLAIVQTEAGEDISRGGCVDHGRLTLMTFNITPPREGWDPERRGHLGAGTLGNLEFSHGCCCCSQVSGVSHHQCGRGRGSGRGRGASLKEQ